LWRGWGGSFEWLPGITITGPPPTPPQREGFVAKLVFQRKTQRFLAPPVEGLGRLD
jgi:hypothetical protein